MRTLYIDCGMGAAGDMLTAALLELLPDREAFLQKLNALGIPSVTVTAEPSTKCGIVGTHNLVLAMDDGRPCEDAVIRKAFRKLQDKADLPRVTFHSLRHLSTGYKLVCSQGDIKSVQGDTGHSRAEMVTDVYAHIVDEDRRNNARRFEADFYANLNLRADYRHDNSQGDNPATIDLRALMVQLRNDPQLAKEFYTLLMDSINGCN